MLRALSTLSRKKLRISAANYVVTVQIALAAAAGGLLQLLHSMEAPPSRTRTALTYGFKTYSQEERDLRFFSPLFSSMKL